MAEEPGLFLLMAAWFGLVTGLGEAAALAVAHFVLHRYVWRLGLDLAWITPCADIFVFLVPGSILFTLARARPGLVPKRVAALILSFLSSASLLLLLPQVAMIAKLVLAAGFAVQFSRLVTSHPRAFSLLISGPFAWLASPVRAGNTARPLSTQAAKTVAESTVKLSRRQVLLGLGGVGATIGSLAVGVQGWQALDEARALARLPRTRPDSPNVLLLVLDTVRAADLSLYGYHRTTTPRLDALARSGVCFERAISTAPWTLPSHASMFTGRYHHELSVGWTNPLDGTYPTLAEVCRAQGYLTAGFAANTYYLSRESGLDRGFAHYEAVRVWPGVLVSDSSLARTVGGDDRTRRLLGYFDEFGRESAAQVNGSFLTWLEAQDPERPFFAFLNYYDAHDPYFPPEPFDTLFGPKRPRVNPLLNPGWHWSQQDVEVEQLAYDGSIAFLDRQVGLLIDGLRHRALLENTLLVIVGDHGEEFHEHGVMGHGNSAYVRSIHVPLIISFPSRIPQGLRVSAPVTLRDLSATIVELARIEGGDVFPGSSLARHWSGAEVDRGQSSSPVLSELEAPPGRLPDWYPASKGKMQSLVVGRYQYIRNGDGREEIYDVENDPLESRNLAEAEEGAPILRQMRSALDTALVDHRV